MGARQNRTTNRSLLLPAKSETKIPVSCMEQGRWHFDSDHFKPTQHCSPSTVRRKARELEAGHAERGVAPAPAMLAEAQHSVWGAIADHSSKLRTRSDTGALNHLYENRAEDLEHWVRDFPGEPDQVGLLAFVGSHPLGLDVIGCRRLYDRLHDRLLRGYVLDALGSSARPQALAPSVAQTYLDQVASARRVDSPTIGDGSYAVLADTVIGGELTSNGQVVHLSAFPTATSTGPAQCISGGGSDLSTEPPPPSSRVT